MAGDILKLNQINTKKKLNKITKISAKKFFFKKKKKKKGYLVGMLFTL
jgi:hypothetical protein